MQGCDMKNYPKKVFFSKNLKSLSHFFPASAIDFLGFFIFEKFSSALENIANITNYNN
jgi:hypothetical protein